VDALCEVGAIDTLLSNFIIPLQGDQIASSTLREDGSRQLGRIHCSLNINTETGRLSARRPNLQNQPAMEKDRYKVGAPSPLCVCVCVCVCV
jgi:DNA polymerase I